MDGYFGQVNNARDDFSFEHRLETVSDVTDMLVADFEERAKIVEATGSWLPMEWFWDFMPRQSKAEIKGDKILKMSSLLRPIRGCYSWSFTVHDPKRRESLGDRTNTGIITGVHLRAHVRRATGRQGEGAARGVRGTGGHVHQCHGGHRARGVLQGSAPVGGGRPGPSSVIDDYNRESTLVAAETKDDRLRLLDVQSGGPVRAPAR